MDKRTDGTDHCAGCGKGVQGFYHPAPNEWLCADCFMDWTKSEKENAEPNPQLLNEIAEGVFQMEKEQVMDFTIIWRLEADGDFFEQTFPLKHFRSASLAIQKWRQVWGLHENDCVIFEVKKGQNNG